MIPKNEPKKTVTSFFQLDNQHANIALQVKLEGHQLQASPHPKYLGITLDTALLYQNHLENVAQKIQT